MGGVAGHMAHLSEDTDLTFNEIVDILGKVANAEITNATEKVDGQNLFLSWTITPDGEVEVARSGDARTARNAGDIKKGGMTTDEYISKWAGHPAESAFTNGFKAISTALRGLSPEDLEAIFANGQRYVNMEIMYPGNPNIILYSSPTSAASSASCTTVFCWATGALAFSTSFSRVSSIALASARFFAIFVL